MNSSAKGYTDSSKEEKTCSLQESSQENTETEYEHMRDHSKTEFSNKIPKLSLNPLTKTYFKCSIYSPSKRLYTVDEVTSVVSYIEGPVDPMDRNNSSLYGSLVSNVKENRKLSSV